MSSNNYDQSSWLIKVQVSRDFCRRNLTVPICVNVLYFYFKIFSIFIDERENKFSTSSNRESVGGLVCQHPDRNMTKICLQCKGTLHSSVLLNKTPSFCQEQKKDSPIGNSVTEGPSAVLCLLIFLSLSPQLIAR